jgi:hypothetical protein
MGYDVRRTGATGNGTADDSDAIEAAAITGSQLYFPRGTYRISVDVSINVPCIFDYCAVLQPDAGVTVTINAPIHAGPWKIFDLKKTGALIRGSFRDSAGFVLLKWWGAACNGTASGGSGTVDDIPVQQCFDALAAMGQGDVRLLAGEYPTLTTNILVTGTQNGGMGRYVPRILGAGSTQCGFNFPSLKAAPNDALYDAIGALVVQTSAGFPGNVMKDCFRDFAMNGKFGDDGSGSTAIEIRHSGQIGLTGIAFNRNRYGLVLHNYSQDTWTEYVQANRCFFAYDCLTALWYRVTHGNPSFKKSGLIECLVTNYGAGNPSRDGKAHPSIVIDRLAEPYQAPMDCSIVGDGVHAFTFIENACANGQASFYGNLQLESGRNLIKLCEGSVALYSGTWNDFGAPNSPGTLILCRGVAYTSTTFIPVGGRSAGCVENVGSGTTTLVSALRAVQGAVCLRQWTVQIIGKNYSYAVVLLGGFPRQKPTVVATLLNYESGNDYGAPGFGCDANGDLTVSNDKWPNGSVSVFFSEEQINAWNFNVHMDHSLF